MPKRRGRAEWSGGLEGGRGSLEIGDGVWKGAYSFGSRFEEGEGTNPEELIAAAHAACFSMALAAGLEKEGFEPRKVATTATVELEVGDAGARIATIRLATEAEVPGIDEGRLVQAAEAAGRACPVSKALAGVEVEVDATLAG